MSEYQELNSFWQKPGSVTRQSFIQKGFATSANCSSKLDVNGLLELLNVTNDINLQLKVFSALSAYLMFNKGANIDVVIKNNAVYDKIQNVLSRGLPRRSTEALNFLSTLLYIDADEDGTTKKKTLAMYARNMTRVSGCLSAMCEMFTNCMLYHDTWKALCQCLALACSGNDMNQSYCSHLIPVCIQKCSQEYIDTLLVLQSLMLNHRRNSQLFLECNGAKIFTRDLLHYDKCLQLLTTLLQCSNASTSIMQQTNVTADLRDFLRLYGPDCQLGQKAIIILKHISSSAKEKKPHHHNTIASKTKMHANKSSIENTPANKSLAENDLDAKTENDFDETKVLIQNVMKEIFNWKQSELQNMKKAESKSVRDLVNRSKIPSLVNKQKYACKRKQLIETCNDINKLMVEKNRRNKLQQTRNTASELSFSFLQNEFQHFQVPKNKNTAKSNFRFHKNDTQILNNDDTQLNDTTFYKTISNTKKNDIQTTATLQDFSPIFASTPKHATESVIFTESPGNSYKTSEEQTKQNKYNNLKMKRQKAKRELQKNKSMKNRTLGARFFGAINESCTTFVKTVKNIFNKKASSNDSRSSSSRATDTTVGKNKRSKTNSFINYMRKRDAVLNNNWVKKKITDPSEVSIEANSCKTCDDTEVLKQKLTKDEFLKQTVKKLKLGINLYGCDFKKISTTMWPRETYMTPLVLYNLYRKLLLK